MFMPILKKIIKQKKETEVRAIQMKLTKKNR